MSANPWSKDFEKGKKMVDFDTSRAVKCFMDASMHAGKEKEMYHDELVEFLLDTFCSKEYASEELVPFAELIYSIYDGSEGQIFLFGDMLERAPAFIDESCCSALFINLFRLSPYVLYPMVDPELFGNVFDGLGALACDSLHHGGAERMGLLAESIFLLRDCFTGCWMDLNEDEFFEIICNLEDTDPEEVGGILVQLFDSAEIGDNERFRKILDDFLGGFFLMN